MFVISHSERRTGPLPVKPGQGWPLSRGLVEVELRDRSRWCGTRSLLLKVPLLLRLKCRNLPVCNGVPPPLPGARVVAVGRASTQPLTAVPAPLSFRDGQVARGEATPVSPPRGPGVVPGAPRLRGQSLPEAAVLEGPRRDTWVQQGLRGAQLLSPPSGGLASAVHEPSMVSQPSSECERGGAARSSPVRSRAKQTGTCDCCCSTPLRVGGTRSGVGWRAPAAHGVSAPVKVLDPGLVPICGLPSSQESPGEGGETSMEATPADPQGASCSHKVGGWGPKRGYREGPSTVGGERVSVAKCVKSATSVSERGCWVRPPDLPRLPRTLLRAGGSSQHFTLKKETATQAHIPSVSAPLKLCKCRILISPKLGQALLSPGINSSALQRSPDEGPPPRESQS